MNGDEEPNFFVSFAESPGVRERMSDTVAIPSPPEGDFERFLKCLDADKSRAAEIYEDLRRRLLRFFMCSHSPRAEELVDRALAILERKMRSEDIRNVFGYALGIARKVQLEASAELRRMVAVEDMPGGENSFKDPRSGDGRVSEEMDEIIRLHCLRHCRTKLPPDDDKLVIAYYSAYSEKQKVHRERLARTMGITMNALRVRTNRIRERLEACVTKCLEKRLGTLAKGYGGGEN